MRKVRFLIQRPESDDMWHAEKMSDWQLPWLPRIGEAVQTDAGKDLMLVGRVDHFPIMQLSEIVFADVDFWVVLDLLDNHGWSVVGDMERYRRDRAEYETQENTTQVATA